MMVSCAMWIVDVCKSVCSIECETIFYTTRNQNKIRKQIRRVSCTFQNRTQDRRTSGVFNWGKGCEPRRPTGTLNVKTWLIFQCSILFVLSRLCFFALFRMFSGYFGLYYGHPHADSLSFINLFSECWLVGPLRWPEGRLQLSSPSGSNV